MLEPNEGLITITNVYFLNGSKPLRSRPNLPAQIMGLVDRLILKPDTRQFGKAFATFQQAIPRTELIGTGIKHRSSESRILWTRTDQGNFSARRESLIGGA